MCRPSAFSSKPIFLFLNWSQAPFHLQSENPLNSNFILTDIIASFCISVPLSLKDHGRA